MKLLSGALPKGSWVSGVGAAAGLKSGQFDQKKIAIKTILFPSCIIKTGRSYLQRNLKLSEKIWVFPALTADIFIDFKVIALFFEIN